MLNANTLDPMQKIVQFWESVLHGANPPYYIGVRRAQALRPAALVPLPCLPGGSGTGTEFLKFWRHWRHGGTQNFKTRRHWRQTGGTSAATAAIHQKCISKE